MHFLKLIRPINLAIIALTMYGVRYYLYHFTSFASDNHVDFALLVGSTILIAAGGNIINDYFDVRADRVNRPKRLIISRHIKRRWAIVSHWTFNALAFFIALYLCWRYHTLWFAIIHITSITLLWWYSVQLKKKPIIGNLVISALTVLVIMLTALFLSKANGPSLIQTIFYDTNDPVLQVNAFYVTLIFMGMAFLQNLCREIIKDVEDIPGDQVIHARTLPMVIGIRASQLFVGFLLLFFPLAYFGGILLYFPSFDWLKSLPITIAAIMNLIAFFTAFGPTERAVPLIKNLLKLSMLSGIIYLFL